MRRFSAALCLVAVAALVPLASRAQELAVPNRPGSVKFAAFGDNGTGETPEYEVADQLDRWHRRFPFDLVIMLGDNMYGSQRPADFVQKFERPYKPLLDAGVKFYASLGNHDKTSNDSYMLFNMGGERYYTYARSNVRFFVLDSNYLDPGQLVWVEKALRDAKEAWKIAYFHHPLYSDGGRHGSEVELRVQLEPIFVRYGVNVVYSGARLQGFGTGTWAVLTASLASRPLGILAAVGLAVAARQSLPPQIGWRDVVVIALAASPSLAFGVFLATTVFPNGPLLIETKLGAISTAAGVLVALAAARLLHVGRFARFASPRERLPATLTEGHA